jgi:Fur family peroxide stress response transcriptional regulator
MEAHTLTPTRDEADRRMAAFLETCRRRGLKVTPQRVEIYRQVAATDEHPDAETVHRRVCETMPTVSLDTVYRTLYLLEDLALVSRVPPLTDRLRFDANTAHHHHFVCAKCGRIQDFYSSEADRLSVPPEVETWGRVLSRHLEICGICSECLQTEGDPENDQ